MAQDMPPKGGYEPVQYKVRLPQESERMDEVECGF